MTHKYYYPAPLFSSPRHVKGFTLVELSIVIVIIGLIVAGITAGKSMVRQAKIRAVMNDMTKYETSIRTFSLQYNGLPGDLPTAYNYWGANCAASAGLCNGDGDRHVTTSTTANDNEPYRMWQHLTLSGILPGNYTGVAVGGSGDQCSPGINAPAHNLAGGGCWHIDWQTVWSAQNIPDSNVLIIGNIYADPGAAALPYWPYGTSFTPAEASGIDTKMDDGKPYSGYWIGAHNAVCTSGTPASSSYSLNSAVYCMLAKRL